MGDRLAIRLLDRREVGYGALDLVFSHELLLSVHRASAGCRHVTGRGGLAWLPQSAERDVAFKDHDPLRTEPVCHLAIKLGERGRTERLRDGPPFGKGVEEPSGLIGVVRNERELDVTGRIQLALHAL